MKIPPIWGIGKDSDGEGEDWIDRGLVASSLTEFAIEHLISFIYPVGSSVMGYNKLNAAFLEDIKEDFMISTQIGNMKIYENPGVAVFLKREKEKSEKYYLTTMLIDHDVTLPPSFKPFREGQI